MDEVDNPYWNAPVPQPDDPSFNPFIHTPLGALERFDYALTSDSRKQSCGGFCTFERPSSGHKVVMYYKEEAALGLKSTFSHWEHYGANGRASKSSTDETKLAPYLRWFHVYNE